MKSFLQANNNRRPTNSNPDEKYLSKWLSTQKLNRKSNKLSNQEIKMIDDLNIKGFNWDSKDTVSVFNQDDDCDTQMLVD